MKSIKDKNNKAIKTSLNNTVFSISESLDQTSLKLLTDSSQKIAKALYLITNFFSETNELRSAIRLKSIEAMQYLFDNLRLDGDSLSLKKGYHTLDELLSYIDIAHQTGYISEMNNNFLVERIHSLQESMLKEIEDKNLEKRELNISLSHLFSSSDNILKPDKTEKSLISEKDVLIKKTVPKTQLKKLVYGTAKISLKEKRHQNILDILKQKKDASINDVCSLFKDCSSKTIQRDLKDLIKNKKVVKRGERRWAVYNLK